MVLTVGLPGFAAIAFRAAGVAQILFFLFLVFFLPSLIRVWRAVPEHGCQDGISARDEPYLRAQCASAMISVLTRFKRIRVGALAAAQRIGSTRLGRLRWKRGILYLVIGTTVITAALVAVGFHHLYFDRTHLPDIEPFTRFEFSTIGHVYDAND
jgi:uncharacterized membrane protein YtjA (UPF0391 family)